MGLVNLWASTQPLVGTELELCYTTNTQMEKRRKKQCHSQWNTTTFSKHQDEIQICCCQLRNDCWAFTHHYNTTAWHTPCAKSWVIQCTWPARLQWGQQVHWVLQLLLLFASAIEERTCWLQVKTQISMLTHNRYKQGWVVAQSKRFRPATINGW